MWNRLFSFQPARHLSIWKTGLIDDNRSVLVNKRIRGGSGLLQGWSQLNRVLSESKFSNKWRLQQRFESNPERRRRKRRQADWSKYLDGMRAQVKEAHELKKRYLDTDLM
jgi:hypothetical protein